MSSEDRVEEIARVCYEANRAYCLTIGDDSQVPWDAAEGWQKSSAIDGVHFLLHHPHAGPEACHQRWLEHKRVEGWSYGPVKQPDARQHPCMLPFESLSSEQQMKDKIFHAIVRAMQ